MLLKNYAAAQRLLSDFFGVSNFLEIWTLLAFDTGQGRGPSISLNPSR